MRFYLAQEGHTVPLLSSQDVHAGTQTPWFNLKTGRHVSIIVALGAVNGQPGAVTVKAATDINGDNAQAIPFDVFECTIQNSDVLGPRTPCTAAGFVPANVADTFYVIELDADTAFNPLFNDTVDVPYCYLAVAIAAGGTAVPATVIAILSDQRFAEDQSPSVLV